MPEVRSGEVNRRERDWLRSRAPLSISPIPFDLIASAAKKGPERVAGADIVRGQKGPVNDGSRSSTHNVSTGDVFQYCGRFTSSGSFAMLIAILRAYRA